MIFLYTLAYTKIIVVGGYDGGAIDDVEAVDLENPSSNCASLSDYPDYEYGMTLGVVGGLVKACGSGDSTDDCYDYDPATDSWSSSTSMLDYREYPKSSFIDGVWLVSGDYYGGYSSTTQSTTDYSTDTSSVIYDTSSTTEIWTGNAFEPGPMLPKRMFRPCQLTINATHVFFTDMAGSRRSYLLDWRRQTWTDLPTMPRYRDDPSCGLINNPDNGLEVVVVEDGYTEIFNFNDLEWRNGPTAPDIDEAGSAQIGDTFVLVGGEDSSGYPIDSIYQFDHLNYDWILMDQRLDYPRENYPGVVAVPDEFVSC